MEGRENRRRGKPRIGARHIDSKKFGEGTVGTGVFFACQTHFQTRNPCPPRHARVFPCLQGGYADRGFSALQGSGLARQTPVPAGSVSFPKYLPPPRPMFPEFLGVNSTR